MTGKPTVPSGVGSEGPTAGDFAGVGFQFAFAIILFLYAGQWIDKRLGTSPWLLILGVFSGAGLGFFSMYRKLMAVQARDDQRRRNGRDGTA